MIAVSKNASTQMISEAVKAGITQFGESRVQEMLSKYRVLEKVLIGISLGLTNQ